MPRVVFSERQPTGSQLWLEISVTKYTYIWRINSYVLGYYSGPGELLWREFFCRAFLEIALRRRINFSVFQKVLNMVLTVTLIYLIAKLQITDRLDGNNIDLFGLKCTLNIFILTTKYTSQVILQDPQINVAVLPCRAFLLIALRRSAAVGVLQRVLNMVLTVTLIFVFSQDKKPILHSASLAETELSFYIFSKKYFNFVPLSGISFRFEKKTPPL